MRISCLPVRWRPRLWERRSRHSRRGSGWSRWIRICCRTSRRRLSWWAMKAGKLLRIGAAVGVLAAMGAGAWKVRRAQAASELPVAPARKGEFLVIVRCRGELKARRSVQVIAPVNVPNLQIVWMAAAGAAVKAGETVIRFDPSSAKQQLQEKEAGLRQSQASLDQALAQQRITTEQDKLDLAAARYELERAKLEVSKAEIVSALQGEQSRIDLGLAEQKLRVQEATFQ